MHAASSVVSAIATRAGELAAVKASTPVPFSIEFSPPKDPAGEARLWRTVRDLEQLRPAFASMTYGAGGKTRNTTIRITGELAAETTLLTVAHLTAVGHSVRELRSVIGGFADVGIRNLLALRGDPPGDPLGEWHQHPEGLRYASELVELARGLGDFSVGVAAFPDGHPRSESLESDAAYLAAKLRAGAEYSVTQMVFDAESYARLRDRVAAADPEQGRKPIIPGIMPVTSLAAIKRMAALGGSHIPQPYLDRLARAAGSGAPDRPENAAAVRQEGITIAIELCQQLIAEGAPCLHFYTLNFSRTTLEVLRGLGITAP